MSKATWKTRDGQVIPIRELADSHLINIVRMLRRVAELKRDAETLLIDGYLCSDPPDGAYFAASAELRELEDADVDELVARNRTGRAILRELRRRKLTA